MAAERIMSVPRTPGSILDSIVELTVMKQGYIPPYSTDISAAVMIVSKLWDEHWFCRMSHSPSPPVPGADNWDVQFLNIDTGVTASYYAHREFTTTLPQAICYAAIKTSGANIDV